MRILVTGGAGYIGSTLVPFLLNHNHHVIVLDRFFFGKEHLEPMSDSGALSLIREDTRWFAPEVLDGVEAVVDMAALSNDPAGELDPWKTIDINYLGRSRVARLAKQAGVKRYLLISSCSVYGFQRGLMTEVSRTHPLTTYAKANLLAEQDNLPLGDLNFCSTVFRFATIYGLSGRMRFDLAINGMVLGAFKTGRIAVMRDGTQWRPFVHVRDAVRAVLMALECDARKVNRQIFNIGSTGQNYQIRELAEMVSRTISNKPGLEWYGTPDERSYRVSFKKAERVLGFRAELTPRDAAKEIETALASGRVKDTLKTKTVEWYKHLLANPKKFKGVSMRGLIL